jgi:hypothetical protein
MIDYTSIVRELCNNSSVFEGLLSNKSKKNYTWKVDESKWNLLEILCHLRDEEVEDFRTRTRYALEQRIKTFPPIDPEGWVKERNYAHENYERVLGDFIKERENSLNWLHSLVVSQVNSVGYIFSVILV